ncbi:MAG: response regulator [Pirellulaceae bacterium]
MIRVLIVDDSRFMAKALRTVLEGLEYNVVGVAHDGLEALALYSEQKPDVMLLDITMPNMDGVECLQRALQSDPEASVIMLSAIKDPEIIDQCMKSGAKAFLQKPIRGTSPTDICRLSEAIDQAVGKAV